MALLDAETLGRVAKARGDGPGPWLNAAALQGFYTDHDRYVPTRQALASAIAEAFRGESDGGRCIRRALFSYWRADLLTRPREVLGLLKEGKWARILSSAPLALRLGLNVMERAVWHLVRILAFKICVRTQFVVRLV